MMQPVEVVATKLLPTIRASLAKALIDDHKMRQVDVADKLGLTQATVSHYYTGCRGADDELAAIFPEIEERVSALAAEVNEGMSRQEQIIWINQFCAELMVTDRFCAYHSRLAELEDCKVCFDHAVAAP